jgi:methionyl-tRNA formyltransferase
MFDTIILLTGPIDEEILATVLRDRNPRLDIRFVTSLADLKALPPELLPRSRLIGFVTPVIVPKSTLNALGYGAYNFHPGPPNYPGSLPSHFAVYNKATEFGATAHLMKERVDTGPIVGVERFAVPPGTPVRGLEQLALNKVALLFWNLSKALANSAEPLPQLPVEWSGRWTTQRDYLKLCEIPADIPPDELERRIGVFGAGHFGIRPTITVHGRKFRYLAEDGDREIEFPSIVSDAPARTAATSP